MWRIICTLKIQVSKRTWTAHRKKCKVRNGRISSLSFTYHWDMEETILTQSFKKTFTALTKLLGKPVSSVITLVQRCAYQLLVQQKDIDDHLEVLGRAALDAKVKLYRARFVQAMQPWVQYFSICLNGFLDQEHKITANTAYCFAFQSYYLLTGVAQRVKMDCIVHCSTNFQGFFWVFLRKMGKESVSLTFESSALWKMLAKDVLAFNLPVSWSLKSVHRKS